MLVTRRLRPGLMPGRRSWPWPRRHARHRAELRPVVVGRRSSAAACRRRPGSGRGMASDPSGCTHCAQDTQPCQPLERECVVTRDEAGREGFARRHRGDSRRQRERHRRLGQIPTQRPHHVRPLAPPKVSLAAVGVGNAFGLVGAALSGPLDQVDRAIMLAACRAPARAANMQRQLPASAVRRG